MPIKTGSFQTGTGAVSTTVVETGVGFTPKAIIFMLQDGFGVALSTSNRWGIANGKTSSSSGNDASYGTNDACVVGMTNHTTLNGKLDLQSMDSDGFTLVVDDQFASDQLDDYIAFSEGDFDAGFLTEPGATGNQSVTSMSFTPKGLIFGTASWTAHNSIQIARSMAIGIASGSSNRGWVNQQVSQSGTDCSTCDNYSVAAGGFSLVECMGAMHHDFGTRNNDSRADLVSLNSDGFTVNWLERKAANFHYWFAFDPGEAHMNSFTTRTDTSNESVVTPGFRPGAIFFLSDANFNGEFFTFGFASSPTERGVSWRNFHDNTTTGSGGGPTGTWSRESDLFYKHVDNGASIVATADLVSIDGLGFTFKMDDADTVARNIGFMAFGEQVAADQVMILM